MMGRVSYLPCAPGDEPPMAVTEALDLLRDEEPVLVAAATRGTIRSGTVARIRTVIAILEDVERYEGRPRD